MYAYSFLPWLTWAQPYPKLLMFFYLVQTQRETCVLEDLVYFSSIKDITFFHKLSFIKIILKGSKMAVNICHAICKLAKASISLLLNDAIGCPCVSCLCNAMSKYCSLQKVEACHLDL